MNKDALSAAGSVALALAITVAVLIASGWRPSAGATLSTAAENGAGARPELAGPTATTDKANLRASEPEVADLNRLSGTLAPVRSANPVSATAGDDDAPGPAPSIIAPFTATAAPPAGPPVAERSRAESRGEEALDTIRFPWKDHLADWTITFVDAHDGAYGYTYPYEQRIKVFIRPSMSDELLRHVLAHEIGHAIDVTRNTGDERDQWAEARGIRGADWWPGGGASDFATGAGDFAESFAVWQVGGNEFRSTLGPRPTEAQLRLLAELASN